MNKRLEKLRGATMVEYALLVALIAIVLIAAVSSLGTKVSESFSESANALVGSGAVTFPPPGDTGGGGGGDGPGGPPPNDDGGGDLVQR